MERYFNSYKYVVVILLKDILIAKRMQRWPCWKIFYSQTHVVMTLWK